jgi:mRNA interferase RelE/StbE
VAGEANLYRIREGDYRIIYTIQDKKLIVLAVKIGDRKEVYR